MSKDAGLDARLYEWGAWFNRSGVCSGWPRKNILHPSWLPPDGGGAVVVAQQTTSDAREREVHEAISAMSDRLLVVVVGKYARRMSSARMALELCVTSAAIDGRLRRAREALAQALHMN